MQRTEAFALFESMIVVAQEELFSFTINSEMSVEHKADKSAVTACDKRIDQKLTQIARGKGLQVVSEEGDHVMEIVEAGNYVTIDPIDGTLGYIEYVNYAVEHDGLSAFGKEDLGSTSDFCLLLGIVENGIPRYGAMYNYITHEKIFVDGSDSNATVRENNVRGYSQPRVVYFDQRFIDDEVNQKLLQVEGVTVVTQAALGLKSLYTVMNPHTEAATVHRVQSAGLWDVMPAAVAARAFGASVFDDHGQQLELTKYILLPGKGATILKGNVFNFVIDMLRQ